MAVRKPLGRALKTAPNERYTVGAEQRLDAFAGDLLTIEGDIRQAKMGLNIADEPVLCTVAQAKRIKHPCHAGVKKYRIGFFKHQIQFTTP